MVQGDFKFDFVNKLYYNLEIHFRRINDLGTLEYSVVVMSFYHLNIEKKNCIKHSCEIKKKSIIYR